MRDWGWKLVAHWVQFINLETKTRQWVKSQEWLPDMLTSPYISLSFAPFPSLSLRSSSPALALCLFLESPVGNVNRDFTAQCRCISRAHISPTCDLHQRRGSWGIFHANEGRGLVMVVVEEAEEEDEAKGAHGEGRRGGWSQYPGAWHSKALWQWWRRPPGWEKLLLQREPAWLNSGPVP